MSRHPSPKPSPEPRPRGRIDAPLALTLLLLALLPACSSTYELRGKVIEGPVSGVLVVRKDDPRLGEDSFGLGGAAIDVTLDPDRLNRQALPRTVSHWSGDFAIPVHATGAGLLEYDAEVIAQLPGHEPAIGQFRLPGRSRRVLVILARGDNRTTRPPSNRILDETIEMGAPYLRD